MLKPGPAHIPLAWMTCLRLHTRWNRAITSMTATAPSFPFTSCQRLSLSVCPSTMPSSQVYGRFVRRRKWRKSAPRSTSARNTVRSMSQSIKKRSNRNLRGRCRNGQVSHRTQALIFSCLSVVGRSRRVSTRSLILCLQCELFPFLWLTRRGSFLIFPTSKHPN